MNLHWSSKYVGIPYVPKGRSAEGCDCWGLVWCAQKIGFGFDLPSYTSDYVSPDEAREVTALINRERHLQAHWKPVLQIQDGDILLFSQDNKIPHAAVAVSPSKMLHMARQEVSEIDNIEPWLKRLTGAYRWQS